MPRFHSTTHEVPRMDAGRFDALTKALGHRLLRRRLLGNIMGGTLSLLGLRDAEIATARKTLSKCKKVKDKKRQKKCIRQVKDRRRHGTDQPRPGSTDSPTLPQCPGGDCSNVLLAAGDIASCASSGDEATAALLDRLGGTIVALGDNVYDSGTTQEFATCYAPSWGRHKSRTRPAVGNHEYGTAGAAGYFGYFGGAAGDPSKGYYSYDLGAWHIVALNSNCSQAGGCHAGSAQETWLRQDLAAHPTNCTLAYWHHPHFSYGNYGNNPATQALWQALYDNGAEIVLSGHDHNYQRYAPQTPSGTRDEAHGIREFVVGTGGKNHNPLGTPPPTVEAFNGDTFGLLQLILHPNGYDWQF